MILPCCGFPFVWAADVLLAAMLDLFTLFRFVGLAFTVGFFGPAVPVHVLVAVTLDAVLPLDTALIIVFGVVLED